MKLDELVDWYQKKIGTYDKQQWEKTVEQKILDGFSSVTLKTAKLKTDLIDVDLVRGSTFPKAKPKQTLLTVIRLAILRYFFLPLYAQWWVKQTSPNIFAILLFLYITQMINWSLYSFNIHRLDQQKQNQSLILPPNISIPEDGDAAAGQTAEEHIVSLSELLIPMSISILLSLIHSQIVATNSSGPKSKHRRYSNNGLNGNKVLRDHTGRIRRRKKLVRARNSETADASRNSNTKKNSHSGVEVLNKSSLTSDLNTTGLKNIKESAIDNVESLHATTCNQRTCYNSKAAIYNLNSDLKSSTENGNSTSTAAIVEEINYYDNTETSMKKRNVNWHSPIISYAIATSLTQEKQQQTSPLSPASNMSASETTTTTNTNYSSAVDTTGSSRSTSHSSSNASQNPSPLKTVRIDHCVQEFYDDLIMRTDDDVPSQRVDNQSDVLPEEPSRRPRHINEDDGFESLNGKSSSGEDNQSPLPSTSTAPPLPIKSQLRLRLNVTSSSNMDKEAEPKLLSANSYRRNIPLSSESDYEKRQSTTTSDAYQQTKKLKSRPSASSEETEEEGDDGETISSPTSLLNNSNYNECTTSATEWLGVTTNSEECSYSSELENSDAFKNNPYTDEDGYDVDFTPNTILNPHGTSDRISVTIWDQRDIKKAQMSVLEIASCIIDRVEAMPETHDYIYIGLVFSFILSIIPCFCRLCEVTLDSDKSSEINYLDLPMLLWEKASFSFYTIFRFAFGYSQWERTILIIGLMQRLCLTLILFIIFSVAERTFKQRLLYAKLFSHLTSSRRARKSNLPHFRLNKVRNIKTWLSVRSYLKKRGPQRSVDVIVSAALMVTLLLLSFLSVEWLKDSVHLHTHLNLEALLWSTTIGVFLLRFMTLGNKIHTKYRSVSVLITEQINLYLQIEQKPKKKDELMVSNSVLKLAADLLKELESPFKISGLSANPYLFTTIKVVILSALSGVLSEMLGFKLKLHKIKIK